MWHVLSTSRTGVTDWSKLTSILLKDLIGTNLKLKDKQRIGEYFKGVKCTLPQRMTIQLIWLNFLE